MSNLINKVIDDFKVNAYHNGQFVQVTKDDTLGHWSVFFFYPADFTFVCPTELGDLADYYEDFKDIDCEIYSVSEDTHFVHKAWADASETIAKIQYPMLADPTGALTRAFDVMIEEAAEELTGALPQTGDDSLPLSMLIALLGASLVAAFALKRRAA